tara:strand:- start:2473 stop:2868 length:396 start_codon:yes stop_codon:yes gene_type:complete
MSQSLLFPELANNETKSIYAQTTAKNLIYETAHRKPNLEELVDTLKTFSLERSIESSDVTDDEKKFLRLAAQRHNGFCYDLIADYYSHSSEQMQRLMEASGLVIVDFDKAIELGFVQLSKNICEQYSEEQK